MLNRRHSAVSFSSDFIRSLLVLCSLVVLACSTERAPSPGEPAASEGHGDAIAWFDGDIEDAFALAKSEGKAVFLYWGAEWCPPCHYLKDKIFKTPEFVAKSREFIPVYLDGDTERAQTLGEELGVKGYPTVIIFSSEGAEITRLPSTIPVDQYASVLDTALAVMRPVKDVLAGVLEVGPEESAPQDLSLIAYYSWSQDDQVGLSAEDEVATFRTLYNETPSALAAEKSRFLTLYLSALASADPEEENLADGDNAELLLAAIALLEDEELIRANLSWLFFAAVETVDLLAPAGSPGHSEIVDSWISTAARLEQDESLSVTDRLYTLFPQLGLSRDTEADEGEPAIPQALVEQVRERVAWAAATVTDDSELQSAMNTMAYLLQEAGLEHEAEALLTERMQDAHAPYYFMSWIGSMKKDAGKSKEALEWYRKAYDSSRGRYSRFRWGSTYLRQALDLDPDNEERIQADSLEILQELLTFDDAFAGGNYSRLGQLEKAYESWNENGNHDDAVESIRDLVLGSCERYPGDGGEESQQMRCASFLAEPSTDGKA